MNISGRTLIVTGLVLIIAGSALSLLKYALDNEMRTVVAKSGATCWVAGGICAYAGSHKRRMEKLK